MSCGGRPTGGAGARSLDELGGEERRRWVDHLEACPRCRARALETDPSLVFSLLAPPPVDRREVDEISRTVLALRRVRRIEDAGGSPWGRRSRAAAAGLLLAGVLFLMPGGGEAPLPTAGSRPAAGWAPPPALTAARRTPPVGPAALIEGLDRPLARIYQTTEEDLSLVMIVDETLDL